MFDLTIKDYTVAAGGRLKLGIPADFFQIMEASGPVNIDFLKSHARTGYAEGVGQGFRLGPVADPFHGVEIYSATAQTLKLCFSRGKSPVDLSQVVSVTGEVSVISGELSRVKNGAAFTGYGYGAATVGQYAFAQLWNQAASGKNLILTRASSVAGVAVSASLYPTSAVAGALYSHGLSKLVGGAASSAANVNHGTTATAFGTSYGDPYISNTLPASSTETLDFPEPFVIPPGTGLLFGLSAVNVAGDFMFQWFEEAI